ncbi:MAG: DUF4251 domain-containing protein [Ginsengibacter sp.]
MKKQYFKSSLKVSFIIIFLSLFLIRCSSTKKVVSFNGNDVKNIIDSSQFTFVAERMNPMRGASRILTSYYDVEVKKDTLSSFLPFFGRSYQAPMDPSKSPLAFHSYNFTYKAQQKNKDQWQVFINPKDRQEIQQLLFTIFNNGTATLNVVSTNRDAISFYGHIVRNKQ